LTAVWEPDPGAGGCFAGAMKIRDALGLGPPEGTTVIPVSVWLPVLVLLSTVAAWILASLDRESALVQVVVIVLAAGLVIPVAAGITLWRRRRHRA
jgi:hypothetical protein